ncbi:DUF11 domain-containing protein [Microbacterium sp. JZ31]|uniref:DUF11 domain-containing protein n=1 Tax=Microbacterium sp. JZ31 TaxID=1906274 RepID=UPI001933F202|nr:DUF11 domain-containing protein [Microbacterium sp. JZ31]
MDLRTGRTGKLRTRRRSLPRAGVAALAALMLAFTSLVALPQSAGAADTVAFESVNRSSTPLQGNPVGGRRSWNANGAILSIGNNLLSCSGANCAQTQSGQRNADNNNFAMADLDVDGLGGTRNSSSSDLNLPAGATVIWAGLYWGARLTGATNASNVTQADARTMKFRGPRDGTTYRELSAEYFFGPNTSSYNAYQGFFDITSLVQQQGSGTYWGADVAAGLGADRYAGWAMTVVYSAPGMPLRNLTVFDGFELIRQGAAGQRTVTVSGFLAPPSGNVDAQLTMLSYEGDLTLTGDYTMLNNTQLASGASPGSNFFNSTNDMNGSLTGTRNPAHRNMLGFDIKNFGVSGVIPNSATSARFTFSSNGDVYYPGAVGLAINLYAPDYSTSTKTVTNADGNSPARPGDRLTYTVTMNNTGLDAATDVVSTDPLPADTTFVPGSLRRVDPATGATIAALPDSGYDAASRTITVGLGAGSTATGGGRMACSGTASCNDDGTSRQAYAFDVTLDDDSGGTTVTNQANLGYVTETTDTPASYQTNPAAVEVAQQADVAITKEMSPDSAPAGAEVSATLTVVNEGPNPAVNTVVTDPLPEGWLDVAIAPAVEGCAIADGALRCDFGTLEDGGTRTVTLVGRTASDTSATSLSNVATVTTDSYDNVPANNVSSDTVALNTSADIVVEKAGPTDPVVPGTEVTWTITARNDGPSLARSVVLYDTLAARASATVTGASITGGTGGTCAPTGASALCSLATLAVGETATMTVTGVLSPALAAGAVAAFNSVRGAAVTPDPNLGNNADDAPLTIGEPRADIRMTKEASPDPAVPGRQITYTLRATNYGPSDAVGATITDTLPDAITGIQASSSSGTCTVEGQTVTCAGIDLQAGTAPGAPGQSITVTITGTIAAEAAGALENTAEATLPPGTIDPDPGTNTPSVTTPLVPQFDLSVAKTTGQTTVPSTGGQEFAYEFEVANTGPSVARGAVLTDDLPAELVFTDDLSGCGAGTWTITDSDARIATCALPDIAPGDSITVTLRVAAVDDIVELSPETITNVASVAAEGDMDDANNEAEFVHQGSPVVDLAVSKTAGASPATAGTALPFQIAVSRLDTEGTAPVVGATYYDLIPAGTTFVSSDAAGAAILSPGQAGYAECVAGFYGAAGAPGDESRACFTATSPTGDLDDSGADTWEFTVTVSLPPGYGEPTVSNTGVVSADYGAFAVYEPNLANNRSTAAVPTVQSADVVARELDVRVPAGQTYLGPGSRRAVHLQIGNNGPSDAVNPSFQITRTLDAYAEDWWTDDPLWECTPTTTVLQCTYDGVLIAGGTLDIDYELVIAGSVDPTVAVPASAQPTGTYAYTPVAADGWNDAFTEPTDPRDYPQAVDPGTYLDFVQVSSATPDPVSTNNRAVDEIEVESAATRLEVTKDPLPGYGTTNPDPSDPDHLAFVAGGQFGYQITARVPREEDSGYADARSVVLDDWLPVGFVPTSASSAGGLCTFTPEFPGPRYHVVCDLGTLAGYGEPAASPVTVNIVGTVDAQANLRWNTANPDGVPDDELDGAAEQVPNKAIAYPATSEEDPGTPLLDPETDCAPDDAPAAGGFIEECATASTSVDIIEQSNLRLVKTADQAVVNAGGSIGFTLTVLNQGPSDVQHALITDTFPAGLTLDPDSPALDGNPDNPDYVAADGETYPLCEDYDAKDTHVIGEGPFEDPVKPDEADPDGETWLCQVLAIGAGEQRSIHLTANVPADFDPTVAHTEDGGLERLAEALVNRANSGAVSWETDLGDNQATAPFDVARLADVAITANASTTTPAAGQLITFSGVATSNGPSDAFNTRGYTDFPAGFIPVSARVPFNDCFWESPPGTPVPPGGGNPSSFSNEWTSPLVTTTDDGAAVPTAELEGSTYDPARQYRLVCGVQGGSATAFAAGAGTSNTVMMWVPADTPTGTYTTADHIENDVPESTYANNDASVDVFVNHVSDTAVVKTLVEPSGDDIERGREATWQIKAYNFGPSVADDVTVSDNVPDNTEFVSATVPDGTCAVYEATGNTADDNPIIRCDLGTLDVSEFTDSDGDGGFDAGEEVTNDRSRIITITLRVLPDVEIGDEICNAAMIGSGSLDPNAGEATDPSDPESGDLTTAGGNNWSQDCATVVEPPATDVSIGITPPTQERRDGERADLTVTVRNNGPDLATGVTAVLETPAGYVDYSGTAIEWPDGMEQPPDGVVGSLTFDVGTLQPGEQVVYAVTGAATGEPGDVLPFTGRTAHDEPDTVEANNVDAAEITILGVPAPTPSPTPTEPGPTPTDPAPEPPAAGPGPADPGGALPPTGADIAGWVIAGVVALALGAGLFWFSRRRRDESSDAATPVDQDV